MKHSNAPRMSKRMQGQLNQEDKPQVAAETEKPLSAGEGQESAVSGEEKQPETASNLTPETVQHLESEGESSLQAKMDQMEKIEVGGGQNKIDIEKALAASQDGPKLIQERIEAAEKIMAETVWPQAVVNGTVGPQPDGSFNVLVSIPEEYVSGVLEAADSSQSTPNQWGSERFLEYLEAYYTPPKGS